MKRILTVLFVVLAAQEIVYLISVGYPHRSYASSGAGPCAHLRESRADESDTPDTSIEIPTPQPCAA